jgi:hypothetical protein
MTIRILFPANFALKSLQMRRLVMSQHFQWLETTQANVTAVIVSRSVNVADVTHEISATVIMLTHVAEDGSFVDNHVRGEAKFEIETLRTEVALEAPLHSDVLLAHVTLNAELVGWRGAAIVTNVAITARRAALMNDTSVLVEVVATSEKFVAGTTEEAFVKLVTNALLERHFAVLTLECGLKDASDGEAEDWFGNWRRNVLEAIGEGQVPLIDRRIHLS